MEYNNKLKILTFPNSKLNIKSKKIKKINCNIKILIKKMFNTMYENKGIGLAAIQIGINLRLIVIDICQLKKKPIALINPVIINYNNFASDYESCLSFPGISVNITRYKYIKVKYFDEYGTKCFIECKGIFSRCLQHEIDHLNGITIFDYLSHIKKQKIIKKICV